MFITEVERAEVAGVVLTLKQRGRVPGQQAPTLRAHGEAGDAGTGSCTQPLRRCSEFSTLIGRGMSRLCSNWLDVDLSDATPALYAIKNQLKAPKPPTK